MWSTNHYLFKEFVFVSNAYQNNGNRFQVSCNCWARVQNDNGACAHYVMVSKFQWKPFWLATQRDAQNDCTASQNRVNFDVLAWAPSPSTPAEVCFPTTFRQGSLCLHQVQLVYWVIVILNCYSDSTWWITALRTACTSYSDSTWSITALRTACTSYSDSTWWITALRTACTRYSDSAWSITALRTACTRYSDSTWSITALRTACTRLWFTPVSSFVLAGDSIQSFSFSTYSVNM